MVLSDQGKKYMTEIISAYPQVFLKMTEAEREAEAEAERAAQSCHRGGGDNAPTMCSGGGKITDEAFQAILEAQSEDNQYLRRIQTLLDDQKSPIARNNEGRLPFEKFAEAAGLDGVTSKQREEALKVLEKPLTCHEVWMGVFILTNYEAFKLTQSILNGRAVTEEDKKELLDDLMFLATSDKDDIVDHNKKLKALTGTVAKRMFTNEMSLSSYAATIAANAQRGTARDINVPTKLPEEVERTRLGNRVWQEKTALMVSATDLPYYQGMLLYLLSIVFSVFYFVTFSSRKAQWIFTLVHSLVLGKKLGHRICCDDGS